MWKLLGRGNMYIIAEGQFHQALWWQEKYCMYFVLGQTMPLFHAALRPRQNGRHFPDDIFKCIFLNKNI